MGNVSACLQFSELMNISFGNVDEKFYGELNAKLGTCDTVERLLMN